MNKILKLFPVALAVVALSSCSNDDDLLGNGGEFKLKSNELLVTVENLDATRAGFVEKEIDSKLKRATIFNEGDVLKIYDDSKDWRPQEWTFAGTVDEQYTNATGAAQGGEGSTAIFQAPPTVPNKYDSGYGIYPSTFVDPVTHVDKRFGEFTDEARLSMKFDFNMLKVMNVTAGRNIDELPTTSDYKGGAACYAPVPMWGVAANQKMTLKYLTAFLRIDVTKVKAAQAKDALGNPADAKWLLIRSDQALTGTFTADGIDPDDNATGLKVQAPVLANADAATLPTAALNAYPKTGADGNTDILVNIGQCGGDLVIYIPIAAGPDAAHKLNHNFKIYLSADVPNADATINFTAAGVSEIANSWTTPIAKSVYRGQTYSIVDDSRNVNTTAHTPYDMTKAIVDADKEAMRDFTITFDNDIKVKNDDQSTQNYYLDLSFTKYGEENYNTPYVLKHNVTVNVNLVKDASAIAARRLFIKTPEGGKQLTLNIGTMTGIDQINVLDGELKSKLVLKRKAIDKLPNVAIGKNNADLVTIKSGAAAIYSNSNFTISTASATNAGDNIDKLTLANGLTKVTIEKGRISTIDFAAADKIAAHVEIYTTGEVGIHTVDYTNVPKTGTTKYTDTYQVNYNSLWDGSTTTQWPTTRLTDGATTIEGAVVTASQLAAMKVAGTPYTVVGTFDLNGTNKTWTPLTNLTKSVKGAKNFNFKDAATRAITGKAVVNNLKGENGLLENWAPAADNDEISNFTFGGTNTVKKAGAGNLGLLVGVVETGKVGVIKNIELTGTTTIQDETATYGKNAAAIAIGGVIGKTSGTAALNLANVQVNNQTSVYGFRYVGGIIGQVGSPVVFGAQKNDGTADMFAANDAAADNDVLNSSTATLTTLMVASAPLSPNLPTTGQFFGGAAVNGADGNIKIFGGLTKDQRTATNWGYYLADANAEYWNWQAYLYYPEIGHCGYEINGSNEVVVKGTWGIIQNLTKNSSDKYAVSKKLKPTVSKDTPVDNDHNNGIYYYGWVKKPF